MSCDSNKTNLGVRWLDTALTRRGLTRWGQVARHSSLITHHSSFRINSAFSLLELLIAVAVTMVFMGAVATTFVQISKGHSYAEARMDALRNGRSALTMMSEELKVTVAKLNNDDYAFIGAGKALFVGDGIDNDGDGSIDEEVVNGVLDTPSATPPVAPLHASLGSRNERPQWVSQPDMGDTQVDVDPCFGRDQLTIVITPKNPLLGVTEKKITYVVTQFDGEDNVLVRQEEILRTGQTVPEITIVPLAFKVVGLDLLYWNSNGDPADPANLNTWQTHWDSTTLLSPALSLPAAVYIRLTMIADARPASQLVLGAPMDVIPLETIVNVETVIGSGLYKRPNL